LLGERITERPTVGTLNDFRTAMGAAHKKETCS
jgi:hypothetical protein